MPAPILPTPTPEELDDLIYYTRASDLPSLKTTLTTLCEKHACPPTTILASAIDIDADGLGSQSCLLHFAAANGALEVIDYLLELLAPPLLPNGAPTAPADKSAPSLVNHRNVAGNTPLHWASLNGCLEVVKALVAVGADAGELNGAGHDAVFEAERSGREEGRRVAQWMLENCKGLDRGSNSQSIGLEDQAEVTDEDLNVEAVTETAEEVENGASKENT